MINILINKLPNIKLFTVFIMKQKFVRDITDSPGNISTLTRTEVLTCIKLYEIANIHRKEVSPRSILSSIGLPVNQLIRHLAKYYNT